MIDIKIENIDESFVKIHCNNGILYELKEKFTFFANNYKWHPKYKAKVWDGKISLLNLQSKTIYRGLVPAIVNFANERGYSWEYDNEVIEFSEKEALDFISKLDLPIEPRDYQIYGFLHSIRNKRCIIISPTGSGKSLLMYLLIRWLQENGINKILVLVPTISLVSQLYSDFKEYSVNNGWDVESNIHQIYSGQDKNSNKPVHISTWQSLYQLDETYFRQYDGIIGDEFHTYQAKSLIHIMSSLKNAQFRIGTTGTLKDSTVNILTLEGLSGPVEIVATASELMERKILADLTIKAILLKHPKEHCKKLEYKDEITYLINSEVRNRFLSNLSVSLKGNNLVLYRIIDHGKYLFEKIKEKAGNRKVFLVYGNTDKDDREMIRKIVDKEKDAIIVASIGVFSVGINIKNINNVIFGSPSKAKNRILQSIGRGLRMSDTKTNVTLYDIADDLSSGKRENHTLKHLTERLELYASENFNCKVIKIELKE